MFFGKRDLSVMSHHIEVKLQNKIQNAMVSEFENVGIYCFSSVISVFVVWLALVSVNTL